MRAEEKAREGELRVDPCFDPCSPGSESGEREEGGESPSEGADKEYRLVYVAGRVRLFERTRPGGRALPKQGRRRREIGRETVSVVARYRDPATGRLKVESLSKPGREEDLTSGEKRKAWARRKNADLAKTAREVAAGRIVGPMSIDEAVKDFLDRARRELRERTVATYEEGIALLKESLAAQNITLTSAIRPPVLSKFRNWLVARPRQRPVKGGKQGEWKRSDQRRSPFAVNRDLRSVSALLHDWRRNGLLPLHDDEIADAIRPMKTPRPLPVFLGSEEIRQLLEAALRHDRKTWTETRKEHAGYGRRGSTLRHEPAAPFVLAVLLAGGRLSEIAGLRWDEVNLKSREIILPPERVKTGAARKIPLDITPALADLLASLRLRAGKAEYVFRGEKPLTEEEGQALLLRLRRYGAPRKFTWQALRRTCGCFLACAPGVYGAASAFMAARRLGHGLAVAERFYLNAITDIPPTAKTLEAAMGIEKQVAQAVRVIAGDADVGQEMPRESGV